LRDIRPRAVRVAGDELGFYPEPALHAGADGIALTGETHRWTQHLTQIEPTVPLEPKHPTVPRPGHDRLVHPICCRAGGVVIPGGVAPDRPHPIETGHLLRFGVVVERPRPPSERTREPRLDDGQGTGDSDGRIRGRAPSREHLQPRVGRQFMRRDDSLDVRAGLWVGRLGRDSRQDTTVRRGPDGAAGEHASDVRPRQAASRPGDERASDDPAHSSQQFAAG
jgi:hypothetical protein